ncbi:MAG: hypothetical protein C0624_08530 [Desulfuromonas sp.]|nr:MAG: hypothetical protein C0624_08530 [Desulfuromonas sp.]
MTLKMLLAASARFLSRLIGYYFATLVVLALLFPEIDKYQIIFFSWLSGALMAVYSQRLVLQRS